MIKVFTVIGARPQFVKAATISRAIANTPGISEVTVHTGQHFDANMSDVFFQEMNIPKPDYHLNVHGLGHGAMTGRMMEGLEKLMIDVQPDVVLTYGDTNSTLAGALTGQKLHLKVAHVEAGLRSFNMKMPEEVNRVLTDRISDILYCPTQTAVDNLHKEGFQQFGSRIVLSGDVMYDAARFYAAKAAETSKIIDHLSLKSFALCTLHRAENTNDLSNLRAICEGLNQIQNEIEVVMPLHPRTKKVLQDSGIELNVRTIDPVGYFDMITLIDNAQLIFTDSGGLQKEAYFFKKPCITMREQTEWMELVDAGANMLTGANTQKLVAAYRHMIGRTISFDDNLYGEGNSAQVIVDDLVNNLSVK